MEEAEVGQFAVLKDGFQLQEPLMPGTRDGYGVMNIWVVSQSLLVPSFLSITNNKSHLCHVGRWLLHRTECQLLRSVSPWP